MATVPKKINAVRVHAGSVRKHVRGFTIIEMASVLAVIGILLAFLVPMVVNGNGGEKREYVEKNKLTNRLIAEGFDAYLNSKYSNGILPTPYSAGGYTATIYNPSDASNAGVQLKQSLLSTHISPTEINDDGKSGAYVRVYQMLTGLTYAIPFEMQSGALVTLTYQFGVIYSTQCRKADATCNPTAATGIPGASPKLTGANYMNYQTAGSDFGLVTTSSLPRQRFMLETTHTHMIELRDALQTDFKTRQIIAAAGDATNFYPTASSSQAGQNPGTNQGCRDGWYSLVTTNLLAQMQSSSLQYGATEWGGAVEFCRDYDPLGSKTPDAPPHKAALRINANVSAGSNPDPAVPGNNVVLTF